MPDAWLVLLTLWSSPPNPDPAPAEDERTVTVYDFIPEDPELLDAALFGPEDRTHRRNVCYLPFRRTSFIGVLVGQASGMLANPVARSPARRAN